MQGGIGLDLVREHDPDLVLLDLHLPDLSGAEVLNRLKGDPATASIPIVVVSADATPSQVERLREAGAAAYMTKPSDVRLLLETVSRYVTATIEVVP
jgi:CheY-like chemotaxis protein